MKLRLKFDKKAILDSLLQNVEKFVLGVVILVFLLMLYSALTTAGRFDKTPEELQTQAVAGQRTIDSTPAEPELDVPDYVSQAERSRLPIKETPYSTVIPWNPPLLPKPPLRDAPPLFAVQQLRGTAEVGAFRVNRTIEPERPDAEPAVPNVMEMGFPTGGGIGGEQTRGQRWVVITALVPFEKQVAAYLETFKPSVLYDSQKDYPFYVDYQVERVEVASAGEAANPDWEKAVTSSLRKAMSDARKEWASSQTTEVVATKYLDSRLVFPLGPLVNRAWDASVAHEPEIPLVKGDAFGRGVGGMPMGGAPMRGMPVPGGAMSGMPMPGGPMRGIPMPGARGFGGPGGEAIVEGTPFGEDESLADEADDRSVEADTAYDDNRTPTYKLLRFFDFNVEPGKQYVYRVRLALYNPNENVKASYLKEPELAKERYLLTKWSDPSPVISVPRDTSILLVSVKPAQSNRDPSAQTLMTKWVERKGLEVSEEFTLTRGQVADFTDVTVEAPGAQNPMQGGLTAAPARGEEPARDPKARPDRNAGRRPKKNDADNAPGRLPGMSPGLPGFGGEFMPGRGMGAPLAAAGPSGKFKVHFLGRATAIDFRGGERLNRNLTAVGEILLLDSDGTLIVRNELDDNPAYEEIISSKSEPPATPGPGIIPGGPSGPGLRGLFGPPGT